MILIIVPILIYYYSVKRFAVNIPFIDEYTDSLAWLNQYHHLSTPGDKFISLFQQANEHRIFAYFLTVLTEYSIFGSLNYIYIQWFGNLGMLVLLFLLAKLAGINKNNLLTIAPVALLLFVPQPELTDLGITTIGVLLHSIFVTAALFFLNKRGTINLTIAILFAFIATFSFGSGMLVYFIGFVILFLNNEKTLKDWSVWSIAMILNIMLYFWHYRFSHGSGHIFDFIQQPVDTILFYFTFFGSIFSPFFPGKLSHYAIAGFIVLMIFGFVLLFKWQRFKKHPVELSVILFLLMSAAASALTRMSFGIAGATAPRYILYQSLFLAFLYIVCIDVFNKWKKWILPILIAGSVFLFCARLNQNLKMMANHKAYLFENIFDYYTNPEKMQTIGLPPAIIVQILDRAIDNGDYLPPTLQQLFLVVKMDNIIIPSSPPNPMLSFTDKYDDYPKFLKIKGWAFLEKGSERNQKTGIVLKSEKQAFIFIANQIERKDVASNFKGAYPGIGNNSGFNILLDKKLCNIPEGNYQLGICIIRDREIMGLNYLNRIVTF